MAKESTWVNLSEAIRIIVRLMKDGGERRASLMTDKWMHQGGDLYCAKSTKGCPNRIMIARYGKNWEKERKKVIKAHGKACTTLKGILRQGKIAGEGHCEGEISPRSITEREWEERDVQLSKSILLGSAYYPAINAVRVKAQDVRREARNSLAASSPEALAAQVHEAKEKTTSSANVVYGRGRPPVADWGAIEDLVFEEFTAKELPDPEGPKGWRTKADLVRFVTDVLTDRREDAGTTTIKRYVDAWIEAYKAKVHK